MARKDIEIRIRAKDDASRKAQKVADAFKNLGAASQKLTGAGDKAAGVLGTMAADLSKLQGRVSGIDAFGKLVNQVERATGVVDQLSKELANSDAVMRQSQARSQAAADASANLRSRLDAEVQARKQRAEQIKTMVSLQNKETKSINDAAKAAQALQTAQVGGKGGFSGPRYPKKGIGTEAGAPFKSAQDSFGVFLAPEIDSALKNKAALDASVASLRESNKRATESIKELKSEMSAASAVERSLTSDTNKAEAQFASLTEKLAKAQANLSQFETEAAEASNNLGKLAISQDAVAKASAKAEDELRRQAAAMQAMSRYSDGAGGVATPRQAAILQKHNALVAAARQEVQTLRDEQARLDQVVRTSSGNITQHSDAYDRVTAAIQRSEIELRKQELALRQAQGQAVSGFGKWARAYNPIIQGSQAAASAQGRFASSAARSAASAGQIAPMARRNATALNQQANAADKAASQILKFGRNARTTLSFMQRIRGEILALTTGFLGFYGALNRGQKAMDAFMSMEKAENRLGVAFEGDTQKVASEIRFLNAEADRLNFTFASLADGYGRISIAASNAGLSVADTRELFTSLTEAARVNGSSLDEMNGVLKALDQMLSKGKIQAEELRGQLGDRMTGAFKMFADGLGMTTQALDEALKKGEVYADRETLLKFARRLSQAYSEQVPDAMSKLAAALGGFERDMEKVNLILANGFVPAVKDALEAFHDFINTTEGADFFGAVGRAAGSVVAALALIPQNIDRIAIAAKALGAIFVGRLFATMAIGIGKGVKSFRDMSIAMATATTATSGFGRVQATVLTLIGRANIAMTAYEMRLRTIASAATTGSLRISAYATAVGLARRAMLLGAAAAQTLWGALGGPVGITVAAVSMIFATWKSDADLATKAIQEHTRQVDLAREAYRNAGEGVKDWYKVFKGFTELDLRNNIAELEQSYNKALKGIRKDAATTGQVLEYHLSKGSAADPLEVADLKKLDDLVQGFLAGTVAVEDFRQGLNDLALTSKSPAVQNLASSMNDTANATDSAGNSIITMNQTLEGAKALLKEMTGNGDETTKALLGLEAGVTEANNAFDNSKLIETYTAAIDELKSKIPGLSDEMDRLKKITELNKTAWEGLSAAWANGDYSKIFEIAGLWAQATNALNQSNLDTVVSGTLVDKIVGVESGGNASAKNPNSTATGAGQFIESTWLKMFKQYFPERAQTMTDAAMLELRKNADIARKMVDLYARENADFLRKMGIQINDANLYLAHFLGPQGAANVLKASPTTPVDQILGADQIASNSSILEGKSAAEVVMWAQRKMGISEQQLAISQDLADLDAEAAKEAQKEAEDAAKKAEDEANATRKRITNLDHEIAQQRLLNDGKAKEAAITDAIRAAKEENPNLTEAEIETIREKTAALWEQQNVMHEIELAEERISQIQTLRQALMDQIEQAQAAGDASQVLALQGELDGVNERLNEAIAAAIAMWEAVGGGEAESKIASLKTLQGAIAASEQQMGAFGITMSNWQGIFDSAISGVVSAFETMAQAIVNGENAIRSFGVALLQMVAQALIQVGALIMKMMILRTLQGMGGGIGAMATVALGGMAGHTGGLVGASAIGSGNSLGQPTWARNALTYHNGGIVGGLRPNEVNATLLKGEEVLTEQDPRHRYNQGGERDSGGGEKIKQVLAIGEDEIANAMQGAAGEKVVMTVIKRNRATLRQELGI